MVPSGQTLVIESGVTVSFQGHYKFLIQGRLLAEGSETDSIYFTAANPGTGWYGMKFDGITSSNDTSKISYCVFELGRANGFDNDAFGGALFMNSVSKLIVRKSRFSNNWALDGGAIATKNSIAIIEGCIVADNVSAFSGGGIYTNGGVLIGNNIISGNRILNSNGSGGALKCRNEVNIIDNTITNNTTYGGYGGGIDCYDCTGNITGNVITYNYNNTAGGGVRLNSSIVNFSNNFVCNNSTNAGGAGMLISGQSNAIMNNNVIANNHEESTYAYAGGGLLLFDSNPTITNNTIVNNSSSSTGGGVFCHSGSAPVFRNCILYGNRAELEGNQVQLNDEQSDPEFYFCNIEGGISDFGLNGNFYTGSHSDILDTVPLFQSPTQYSGIGFDALAADWSLQAGSPCINAGDPSGTYPSLDIAGNPRVMEGNIDIGAYEEVFVGIENNLPKHIMLYPNPTSDNVRLILTNEDENATLSVFTPSGQLLESLTITGQLGTEYELPESPGIYLFRFVTPEGDNFSFRVIKQ